MSDARKTIEKIGGWNYRVFRRVDEYGDEEYSLRETYYNEETEEVILWTEQAQPAYGESLEGLREVLNYMLLALDKPVIDEQEQLAKYEQV